MRFSLLGFPVRVHPSHFLVAALFGVGGELDGDGLLRLAIWVAVVFVSVLWHELGHAVAMRRFGAHPAIELIAFGGVTRWRTMEEMPTPKQRAVVGLAGPLAGVALGAAFVGVHMALRPDRDSLQAALLLNLIWVNLGWGLLNLVPILPLDGGVVTEAVLDHFTDNEGRRPALVLSVVVASLACVAALMVGWWMPAMFAAIFGIGAFQALRQKDDDAGPDAALVEELKAGWQALNDGQLVSARAITTQLLSKARTPHMRARILELRAWTMLAEGKAESAFQVIDAVPEGEHISRLLEANIAVARGLPGHAVQLLRLELREAPSPKVLRALVDAEIAERSPEAVPGVLFGDEGGDVVDRYTAAFASARLFRARAYETSREVSEEAFKRWQHPEDAFNAACASVRLDEKDRALEWLEHAVDAGFDDRAHLVDDEDLAPLHGDERFEALAARVPDAAQAAGGGAAAEG